MRVAVALGVGAVEAALEGPGVGRGSTHALAPAVAVAAGGRGREAAAHGARRRRRGARRGGAGAVVVRAVEPALLARRVNVVGRHGSSPTCRFQ